MANTVSALDHSNIVIKRLWCTYRLILLLLLFWLKCSSWEFLNVFSGCFNFSKFCLLDISHNRCCCLSVFFFFNFLEFQIITRYIDSYLNSVEADLITPTDHKYFYYSSIIVTHETANLKYSNFRAIAET